jgi:hypothetical protein
VARSDDADHVCQELTSRGCGLTALEADGARRLWNESFFSAPQLKRDPLGCATRVNYETVFQNHSVGGSEAPLASVGRVRSSCRHKGNASLVGASAGFLGRVPSPVPEGFAIVVWEREPVSAPRALVEGGTRATLIGAQPNQRLKLTPPGVCGRIPFVVIPVRRRSLAAIR